MTPELKDKLQTFLFDSTPLWDSEDLELIANWIDENISSEYSVEIERVKADNKLYVGIAKGLMDAGTKIIELKELLRDSVKLIKYWHGQSNYLGGKMPFVIEEIWQEYYDNSPELKGIREALK